MCLLQYSKEGASQYGFWYMHVFRNLTEDGWASKNY